MSIKLGRVQITLTKITHGIGLFVVTNRYEIHKLKKVHIVLTKIAHGVGLFIVIGQYEVHLEGFRGKPRFVKEVKVESKSRK